MRKKRVSLLIFAILLSALSGMLLLSLNRPPAAEDVLAALSDLQGEEYYEFREQCILHIDGETRDYFTLTGERAGENMHLKGTVLGTPTELYLVDSVLYQQLENGEWLINTFPDHERTVSLFTELDPAAAFPVTGDVGEPKRQGKFWETEIRAGESGWIGDYFTNLQVTVSTDREKRLSEAELTGILKEDGKSRLTLTLTITERKENLTVEAPEI